MADTKVIADRSDIVAIADAVRSKTGKADELTLAEMPGEIQSISGQGQSIPAYAGEVEVD
jgi:hypothetical protein